MINSTDFKKNIFDKLSELTTAVYQERPQVLSDIPVIVFSVEETPEWTLEKEYGAENSVALVDVFGNSSDETETIKSEIVEKMIELNYRVSQVTQIPDPDGYSHLRLDFIY